MNTDTTYNGWTNYETWLVKLWIDNEEGSHRYWHDAADACLEQAQADKHFTQSERARLTLADQLKDSYDDAQADLLDSAKLSASVWADLLNAALSSVDWHEIASSFINEAVRRLPAQSGA